MKKICISIYIITLLLNNIYAEVYDINKIKCPAFILTEKNSNRVILEKESKKKRSIASLTKVLTAIVVLETAKLNDVVEISSKSASIGGSTVGLDKNAKVSVENLLYSLMLCSGNDAAIALAEHIGGSVEGFSVYMNNKAKELGAYNSHFVSPHGLDNEEHYSTALDMAKITSHALNIKKFREIITTKSITVNLGTHTKRINNTNRLLKTYEYTTGVKTGFTNKANRCFIGSAKKEDLEYIAVVLGNETTDLRFNNAETLLRYGVDNYTNVELDNILNWYINIKINKGAKEEYKVYEKAKFTYPLKKGELEKISVTNEVMRELNAPCNKGMKIGEVKATLDNKVIYVKEIFLKEKIEKKQIKDYLLYGVKNIFNIDIEF